MEAKPLPENPVLGDYLEEAGALLESAQSGDAQALQRLERALAGVKKTGAPGSGAASWQRGDALQVVAWERGFSGWGAFQDHLTALAAQGSTAALFERAVDAVVNGAADELRRLLAEDPGLVRHCSPRRHGATLLLYAAANGVENYRQKTPPNAVEIMTMLLEAGADVKAEGHIYGRSRVLGLAATSVFPFLAGVQNELIDLLLAHGSGEAEDLRALVNACLANGRNTAAEHLVKRGAPLDLEGAAGVGALDAVKAFFNADGSLKPPATSRQAESGLMWACEYGHAGVVAFLLEAGVSADAMPRGETGLHWAAYGAHAGIVELLLHRKAGVHVVDHRHGGTPLGWALYAWSSAAAGPEASRYCQVAAQLAAAGAKLDWAWLEGACRGKRLGSMIRADPGMAAIFAGQIPA